LLDGSASEETEKKEKNRKEEQKEREHRENGRKNDVLPKLNLV